MIHQFSNCFFNKNQEVYNARYYEWGFKFRKSP